jgi:hypothetical protein
MFHRNAVRCRRSWQRSPGYRENPAALRLIPAKNEVKPCHHHS